ncbi:hypothetical protein [Luteibacter sp. ME-Dv--P-043b]|uniref:hypothetical protein n=1 Tax=Luteibacter sp. ME-Dv--P-043b TaxID=3040291 RepID=UPI002553B75D|nr:hypothetical protein [Luteibacter sp. ME-Dv--P-043b]
MMSGNTWNQWFVFARALRFKVLEGSSGIYMYWSPPDGAHHGKIFRRQRQLMGHLRRLAVGYLRLNCVIRLDARYAFTSGDHSLIHRMMDAGRPSASDDARAAHRLHQTIAKRTHPARGRINLQQAVPNVQALMDTDQDEWYAEVAGEELAKQSARQIERELCQAPTAVVRPPTLQAFASPLPAEWNIDGRFVPSSSAAF